MMIKSRDDKEYFSCLDKAFSAQGFVRLKKNVYTENTKKRPYCFWINEQYRYGMIQVIAGVCFFDEEVFLCLCKKYGENYMMGMKSSMPIKNSFLCINFDQFLILQKIHVKSSRFYISNYDDMINKTRNLAREAMEIENVFLKDIFAIRDVLKFIKNYDNTVAYDTGLLISCLEKVLT